MPDRIREDGLQLLRAIKERHEERNPEEPLREGAEVEPGVVAYKVGLAPGSRYYELIVDELEIEGALEPLRRANSGIGDLLFRITRWGLEMMDK